MTLLDLCIKQKHLTFLTCSVRLRTPTPIGIWYLKQQIQKPEKNTGPTKEEDETLALTDKEKAKSINISSNAESKLNNLLPTSTHLQPISLENKEVPLLSQVVLNREAVSRKINPLQVKKSVPDNIHLKLLRVLIPSQYWSWSCVFAMESSKDYANTQSYGQRRRIWDPVSSSWSPTGLSFRTYIICFIFQQFSNLCGFGHTCSLTTPNCTVLVTMGM